MSELYSAGMTVNESPARRVLLSAAECIEAGQLGRKGLWAFLNYGARSRAESAPQVFLALCEEAGTSMLYIRETLRLEGDLPALLRRAARRA
jgi:hypothetical protein